ncbi:ribokinase [Paenibacillus sp. LMG 31456]|uniref:Ribokinase n=1 Tax=Paenibacillus foliorum TaxID=2654974 RepID=A0A972H859_9BACL|nr:ribokinase [Paenibacillus foliorum]NOU98176.1 ribokinase [Paenibacillus foliorum]
MKHPHIVIVGSLNMDLVVTTERMPRIGETIEGQHIRYLPGGKGANQAVGCAKLEAVATMIGSVGDDVFGSQIIQQLTQYGVMTERISVIDQVPTGTATILHTAEDNCIVVVPGANAHTNEQLVAENESLIREADIVLLQLEIPTPAVKLALEIAHSNGVRTVLNPAPAKILPDEIHELIDILTPNETEFELLSQRTYANEEELTEGMRKWESLHRQTLIVTRGEHGVSYLENDQLMTIPAIRVQVADTTGAGDAFNAALCCGLASGQSLESSIRSAVKAASLSVTKFGAQDGMPTLHEVTKA